MSEHTKEINPEVEEYIDEQKLEEHQDEQEEDSENTILTESEEDIPVLEESLTDLENSPSSKLEDVHKEHSDEDEIPTLEMNVDLGYTEEDYVSEDDDEAFVIEPSSDIALEPEDENIATLEAIVFGGDDPTAPAPEHLVKPLIDTQTDDQADSETDNDFGVETSELDDAPINSSNPISAEDSEPTTASPSEVNTSSSPAHIASEKAQKAVQSSQSLEQKLSSSELTPDSVTQEAKATSDSAKPLMEAGKPDEAAKSTILKGENPFLPKHILERLNHGKRNLVEEIAQSGAALDASTALLRTRARSERLNKSFHTPEPPTDHQQPAPSKDKAELKKQKIIDDLVEDYLPLLAAELRRRLKKMLDEE